MSLEGLVDESNCWKGLPENHHLYKSFFWLPLPLWVELFDLMNETEENSVRKQIIQNNIFLPRNLYPFDNTENKKQWTRQLHDTSFKTYISILFGNLSRLFFLLFLQLITMHFECRPVFNTKFITEKHANKDYEVS